MGIHATHSGSVASANTVGAGGSFTPAVTSSTVSSRSTAPSGGAGSQWSSGIHGSSYQGGGGDYGGGSFGPQEGGFNRSADPIELINTYLDKQSRKKCKHAKGDPDHIEAA